MSVVYVFIAVYCLQERHHQLELPQLPGQRSPQKPVESERPEIDVKHPRDDVVRFFRGRRLLFCFSRTLSHYLLNGRSFGFDMVVSAITDKRNKHPTLSPARLLLGSVTRHILAVPPQASRVWDLWEPQWPTERHCWAQQPLRGDTASSQFSALLSRQRRRLMIGRWYLTGDCRRESALRCVKARYREV